MDQAFFQPAGLAVTWPQDLSAQKAGGSQLVPTLSFADHRSVLSLWCGSSIWTPLSVIKFTIVSINLIVNPSSNIQGFMAQSGPLPSIKLLLGIPMVKIGFQKDYINKIQIWAYFLEFGHHRIISSDFTNLSTQYTAKSLFLRLSQEML